MNKHSKKRLITEQKLIFPEGTNQWKYERWEGTSRRGVFTSHDRKTLSEIKARFGIQSWVSFKLKEDKYHE